MDTVTLAAFPQAVALPPEPVWRLTLDQYQAMVRSQILTEADALEFLDGFLIPKMIKNPPHRISTQLLRQVLEAWIPEGYYVDSQEPITLATSEPEPDVTVIQGKTTDYRDRHPGGADVLLVVEVADATLARDRGLKQRLYSAAGIPHYWI
uniref:Uma2 family endonuclease n=1 Tax=Prochlorothrix hollandica TaxID=1223 RepID=UPI003342DA57